MATPNIVNVATINAKNATGAVTTSRAVAVDVSADKVAKINTILIANIDGSNAADITLEVSVDNGSNYVKIASFESRNIDKSKYLTKSGEHINTPSKKTILVGVKVFSSEKVFFIQSYFL